MDDQIRNIFLTREFHSEAKNIHANTDVIVELDSGEKYIASFFIFDNVVVTREKHLQSERLIESKYFWKKNMVLVDECSKGNIQLIVRHLLEIGDFRTVFEKI